MSFRSVRRIGFFVLSGEVSFPLCAGLSCLMLRTLPCNPRNVLNWPCLNYELCYCPPALVMLANCQAAGAHQATDQPEQPLQL